MFQIILWILKIIGILLAAILGIAVLLICIVLFVPVRYRIEAESAGTFESIDAHARFSWLLHLFSGYFKYQNGEFCWQIRIGWKKLNQTEHIETLQNETYREKESEKEQEKRDEEVPQKAEPTNIPTKKEPQEKKVKRNRTAKKCGETAERAKIIQPSHMIIMFMRNQHSIDLSKRNAQHLFPKIRTAIQQYSSVVSIHQC